MNDSRNRPRIKFVADWLKGIKMDIPYSRWVMFSIGVYVLSLAASRLADAVVTLLPLLR